MPHAVRARRIKAKREAKQQKIDPEGKRTFTAAFLSSGIPILFFRKPEYIAPSARLAISFGGKDDDAGNEIGRRIHNLWADGLYVRGMYSKRNHKPGVQTLFSGDK